MRTNRRAPGMYEVPSDSDASKLYVVSWGTEGDHWSCTCTNYAIQRNKRKKLGLVDPYQCKHIRLVDSMATASDRKVTAFREVDPDKLAGAQEGALAILQQLNNNG